jgi:hypothetical protein
MLLLEKGHNIYKLLALYLSKMDNYNKDDYARKTSKPVGQLIDFLNKEMGDLEQELKNSPEIEPVKVQVVKFKGEIAFGKAYYQQKWVPVYLDRKSVEQCGLKEDDIFKWIPKRNGIVRMEDVYEHPGNLTKEDIEEGRQAGEYLRNNPPKNR